MSALSDSLPYAIEEIRDLLDQWTEGLAQVLESMTDQRPEVKWQAAAGGMSPAEQDLLWWEQPFQGNPDAVVWIAAPRATWEHIGTLTLKAAGLETIESTEARNTWLEILGQSLGAMARCISGFLGREINTENGSERAADPLPTHFATVQLSFPDAAEIPQLSVALSSKLIALITEPQSGQEQKASPEDGSGSNAADKSAPLSRTMELLLDVDLPVSISFGKARLPMKDVLKLTTGSIVELDRGISEPVEVLVNHCLIARGEVVVLEGNYGIRIQEIASRKDRLRSLR